MTGSKSRIYWIDSYKGFTMLLIMVGHLQMMFPIYASYWRDAFASMSVPAFFFISGYLFKNKHTSLSVFIGHRVRQLLIPYFIFYIAIFLFWQFLYDATNRDLLSVTDQFVTMLMGVANGDMLTATPLWFITALFVVEIYFFFMITYIKRESWLILVLVLSGLLGFMTSQYLPFRVPWNAEVALTAVVYYGAGHLIHKHDLTDLFVTRKSYTSVILIITLISISIFLSLDNYTLLAKNILNNGLLMYISAFSGIFALIMITKISAVEKSDFLHYVARNSYLILAFHLTLMIVLKIVVLDVMQVTMPTEAVGKTIWGIIYFSIIILLMVPIIEIFNRVFPYALSSRPDKKREKKSMRPFIRSHDVVAH